MKNEQGELKSDAWIGDAVLTLFAREWILEKGEMAFSERSSLFTDMTSNSFLRAFGEPTKIEAKIGQVYSRDGLEASYEWIEKNLVPVFEKQLKNQAKASRGGK